MKHYELLINAKDIIGHINPEIYGHFSEHLGRCIYNGIYVGENSSVPNIKGIRADMIEALRNIKIPVLRWPGGSSTWWVAISNPICWRLRPTRRSFVSTGSWGVRRRPKRAMPSSTSSSTDAISATSTCARRC